MPAPETSSAAPDAEVDPPELTPFLAAWFARATLTRGLWVSAVVGTVLLAINQGDLILGGAFPPLWKVLMTYSVPYVVSSGSSVAALRDQERAAISAADRGAPGR